MTYKLDRKTMEATQQGPLKPTEGCLQCDHYFDDGESEEGYLLYSYPRCRLKPMYENLKSFPFKKEMACFQWECWNVFNIDPELKAMFDSEMTETGWTSYEKTYARYLEKYTPNTPAIP